MRCTTLRLPISRSALVAKSWRKSWKRKAVTPAVGHVVVGDVADQLVLAEELDQQRKTLPDVAVGGVMLALLQPIAPGHVVERLRPRGQRRELRKRWPG